MAGKHSQRKNRRRVGRDRGSGGLALITTSSAQVPNNRRINQMSIPRIILPDRVFVELSYSDTAGYSTSAFADYIYRLNSIWDPDFTGTGTQPIGYNFWTAGYSRYRVWRAIVTLDFNNTENDLVLGVAGMLATNNATALTATPTLIGNPFHKYKLTSPSGNSMRLRMDLWLPQITGQSDIQYEGNTNTQSNFNASPGEFIMLHNYYGITSGGTIDGARIISIRYGVCFYDRATLT